MLVAGLRTLVWLYVVDTSANKVFIQIRISITNNTIPAVTVRRYHSKSKHCYARYILENKRDVYSRRGSSDLVLARYGEGRI
jgi:hypothetical protein